MKGTRNMGFTRTGLCCALIGCCFVCQVIASSYNSAHIESENLSGHRTKRLYGWLYSDNPSTREVQQRIQAMRDLNSMLLSRMHYSTRPFWRYNPYAFNWASGKRRYNVINIRK